MADLKLDQTSGDVIVANGDLVLTDAEDAVRQHVQQRLRTFLGEWFLNTAVGVPYYQNILKKNPNPSIIAGVFQNEIIQTPGVLELLDFNLDFNNGTRKLRLDFKVRVTTGVINFEELLGI